MVRPNQARKFLCCILSLAILINPALALAATKTQAVQFTPDFQGQQFDGLRRFQFQTADDLALEEELNRAYAATGGSPLEKIADRNDPVQTIQFYHRAYIQAREKMRADYERLGPETFVEELNKDQILYDIPGAGKVEFSAVDGYPTARITDQYSGVKFIFVEPEVEQDSKAFKRLIAEMWYNSGYRRPTYQFQTPDGQVHKVPLGRDVILVSVSGDQVIDNGIQLLPKPKSRKEKIAAWWRATYQPPTWYTAWVGTLSAVAQATSAKIMSVAFVWGTSHLWNMHVAASHSPGAVAYLSLGFAFTLGLFTRFYQNWRSRGLTVRELERKDQVTNVAMYLGIKAISPGGLTQMINIWSPLSTAFNLAQFWISLQISKKLKQPFNKFSDIKKRLRQDQGWVTSKIPIITRDESGKYHVTTVDRKILKKTDWYRQFKYYLPRNAMTQSDRMWFTWMQAEYRAGDANWFTPWLSTLALAAMIPVMWKIARKWAQKRYAGTEELARIEKDSEQYLNPRQAAVSMVEGVPFVGKAWSQWMEQLLSKSESQSCQGFLLRRPLSDDVQ